MAISLWHLIILAAAPFVILAPAIWASTRIATSGLGRNVKAKMFAGAYILTCVVLLFSTMLGDRPSIAIDAIVSGTFAAISALVVWGFTSIALSDLNKRKKIALFASAYILYCGLCGFGLVVLTSFFSQ